jgi:hypothetical protein
MAVLFVIPAEAGISVNEFQVRKNRLNFNEIWFPVPFDSAQGAEIGLLMSEGIHSLVGSVSGGDL